MHFQRFSVVVASSEPVDEEQIQEFLNGYPDILAEVSCVSVGRIFAAAEEAEETEETEDTEDTEDTGEAEEAEETEEEETEEQEVENGAGSDPVRRAIGDRVYASFSELRQQMQENNISAAAVCRLTGLHGPDWSSAKRVGKLFPFMKQRLLQYLGIVIEE